MKEKRKERNLKFREISKKTMCVAASLTLVVSGLAVHSNETKAAYSVGEHSVRALTSVNDISYEETLNYVENPGMGFYSPLRMNLTEEGDELNESIRNNLLHLRVDLSHFSPYYREQKGLGALPDYHINEEALNALETQLKKCRANHRSVIIRFAYDPSFESGASYEPEKVVTVDGQDYHICDSDLINQHQEDLSGVLHEYKDVIVALEAGLIGQWGEMHGSEKSLQAYDAKKQKVVASPEHYNKIFDKWLELLDDTEISVLARKMTDYLNFANENSFKDAYVEYDNLGVNIPTVGMKEYKLGIYNDAYLGSPTDRGTYGDYASRSSAIKWLKSQTKHTLYGGEVAIWDDTEIPDVKRFNTLSHITKEAFDTHTSYLNSGWNDVALAQLKGDANSEDPLLLDDADAGNYDSNYEGQNGYVYLRNHLGYRYVARSIKLTKETTNYENFGIEAEIENVGFANIVRSKKLKLIMESEDGDLYEYALANADESKNEKSENANVIEWASDDKATTKKNEGLTTFKAQVDLDDDMPNGNYKVYLRIADSDDSKGLSGYPVKFANKGLEAEKTDETDEGIFNETLGANYFGDFTIVDKSTIEKSTENVTTKNNITVSKKDTSANATNTSKSKKNTKVVNTITKGKELSIKAGKNTFKVKVNSVKGKIAEVKVVKVIKSSANIVIPNEVKSNGYTLKVTEIGDKAFFKCSAKSITINKDVKKIGKQAFFGMKKCKTIIIKSNGLTKKSIGKKAFAKMNKKIVVKANKKKIKAYKKLLKKGGISKKAKFKKI